MPSLSATSQACKHDAWGGRVTGGGWQQRPPADAPNPQFQLQHSHLLAPAPPRLPPAFPNRAPSSPCTPPPPTASSSTRTCWPQPTSVMSSPSCSGGSGRQHVTTAQWSAGGGSLLIPLLEQTRQPPLFEPPNLCPLNLHIQHTPSREHVPAPPAPCPAGFQSPPRAPAPPLQGRGREGPGGDKVQRWKGNSQEARLDTAAAVAAWFMPEPTRPPTHPSGTASWPRKTQLGLGSGWTPAAGPWPHAGRWASQPATGMGAGGWCGCCVGEACVLEHEAAAGKGRHLWCWRAGAPALLPLANHPPTCPDPRYVCEEGLGGLGVVVAAVANRACRRRWQSRRWGNPRCGAGGGAVGRAHDPERRLFRRCIPRPPLPTPTLPALAP